MLEILRRITHELNNAANLDEALATVVHRVKEHLSVDVCSIYLMDAASANCILMATHGMDPRTVGRVQFGPQEGLVGLVINDRQPLHVTNAHQHPQFRYFPEFGEAAYQTFFGVPIIHYRKVLGALAVRQANDRVFTAAEESFLTTVAAALAGCVTGPALTVTLGTMPTQVLRGIKASPGVAEGVAVLPTPLADLTAVRDYSVSDVQAEEHLFRQAVTAVQAEVRLSGERMATVVPNEVHAMFRLYSALLDNDTLFADAITRIDAGLCAAAALRDTIAEHVQVFERMQDPYLRARAEDIRALGRRVLIRLQSGHLEQREYPDRCVLVGEEVSIARIADVPVGQLAGIVCTRGSAYSHAAILARTLNIPAVMGIGSIALDQLAGRRVLVDGNQGLIVVDPRPDTVVPLPLSDHPIPSIQPEGLRDMPAQMADGVKVSLLANAGLPVDIGQALDSGADGIGLFRTEFTFMMREAFPSEEEQYQLYREVLGAFAPKPVVMRTLDVGGDKGLSYFAVREDNPALGWRGIRLTLDNPGIFVAQLRAMLRANAESHNLSILLPMISVAGEVDEARELLARCHRDLLREGFAVTLPKLGAMIEVPSAIYQLKELAKRVDFFSIGTNDLTQYLLAVDRNNARVAKRFDGLHPAVLRAIHDIASQAKESGTPLSVCGEMAGNPLSAILLLGMGVFSLSMAAPQIAGVKQALRVFTVERAQILVKEALQCADSAAVRALLSVAFQKLQLSLAP